MAVLVLGEEEQRSEADLLDVQPDKDVLNRLREEQSARLTPGLAIAHPEEQVLVQLVEQEECRKRKAVNDWRDDAVRERCVFIRVSPAERGIYASV